MYCFIRNSQSRNLPKTLKRVSMPRCLPIILKNLKQRAHYNSTFNKYYTIYFALRVIKRESAHAATAWLHWLPSHLIARKAVMN